MISQNYFIFLFYSVNFNHLSIDLHTTFVGITVHHTYHQATYGVVRSPWLVENKEYHIYLWEVIVLVHPIYISCLL